LFQLNLLHAFTQIGLLFDRHQRGHKLTHLFLLTTPIQPAEHVSNAIKVER